MSGYIVCLTLLDKHLAIPCCYRLIPHRQRGGKSQLSITLLTDNQFSSFSAICTLPAQNGVFNYKESHYFFTTVE